MYRQLDSLLEQANATVNSTWIYSIFHYTANSTWIYVSELFLDVSVSVRMKTKRKKNTSSRSTPVSNESISRKFPKDVAGKVKATQLNNSFIDFPFRQKKLGKETVHCRQLTSRKETDSSTHLDKQVQEHNASSERIQGSICTAPKRFTVVLEGKTVKDTWVRLFLTVVTDSGVNLLLTSLIIYCACGLFSSVWTVGLEEEYSIVLHVGLVRDEYSV